MKQKQLQCNNQNRPVDLNEESLMGLGKIYFQNVTLDDTILVHKVKLNT